MNVGQLILQLQNFDPELEVEVCCCHYCEGHMSRHVSVEETHWDGAAVLEIAGEDEP